MHPSLSLKSLPKRFAVGSATLFLVYWTFSFLCFSIEMQKSRTSSIPTTKGAADREVPNQNAQVGSLTMTWSTNVRRHCGRRNANANDGHAKQSTQHLCCVCSFRNSSGRSPHNTIQRLTGAAGRRLRSPVCVLCNRCGVFHCRSRRQQHVLRSSGSGRSSRSR